MSLKTLLASAALLMAIGVSSSASAATMATSDQCAAGGRDFTVNVTAGSIECFRVGNDNLQGDGPNDLFTSSLNLTFIDKDVGPTGSGYPETSLVVTGIGATSGTFTVDSSLYSQFSSLVIAFVTGGGQLDPRYAAFTLMGGATNGTFSITPPQGSGISHINLYGGTRTIVPGPIAGAGLPVLMALGGLVWARRRKAAATA